MSIVPPAEPAETDLPLFAGYEPPEIEPEPELSAGQRLTRRQQENVSNGIHPLTKGKLHPLASRNRDADSPKRDPFTCGSCYFREVVQYHNRSYAKCVLPGPVRTYRKGEDGTWRWETVEGAPRATHSAASDVRAWWPACPDYSPGDLLSNDAARHIPGGDA